MNKQLIECGTCHNMVESKGQLTVYSNYHGPSSLRFFDYCRSEGCFQTAKKNQKAYWKELANDTWIG